MKRHCWVKESIKESLKQIKEMRKSKHKFKTWRECKILWNKLRKELEFEEKMDKNKTAIDKMLEKIKQLHKNNNIGSAKDKYINMEDLKMVVKINSEVKKMINRKLDSMLQDIKTYAAKTNEEMIKRNKRIMEFLEYKQKILYALMKLENK